VSPCYTCAYDAERCAFGRKHAHTGYDIGRRRGQKNQRNPDCSQKHFAHALADAGATVVLGSHPTIIQVSLLLPPALSIPLVCGPCRSKASPMARLFTVSHTHQHTYTRTHIHASDSSLDQRSLDSTSSVERHVFADSLKRRSPGCFSASHSFSPLRFNWLRLLCSQLRCFSALPLNAPCPYCTLQGYEKYRASDLRDVLIAYSLGDFTSSSTMNLTAIADNDNNSSSTLHASALFNSTAPILPHSSSVQADSAASNHSSNHSSSVQADSAASNHSSSAAAPAEDLSEELETLKRYSVLLNVQLTWDHKRQFAHVSCFSFLPLTRLSRVTGHHLADSPDQSTSTTTVTEYSVITVRARGRERERVYVRAWVCERVRSLPCTSSTLTRSLNNLTMVGAVAPAEVVVVNERDDSDRVGCGRTRELRGRWRRSSVSARRLRSSSRRCCRCVRAVSVVDMRKNPTRGKAIG
jgi:hypothetical protein